MDKQPLDSKKWTGMALCLIAGLLASAGAVAVGGVAITILPTVLTFIAGVCVSHQTAQVVSDVSNDKVKVAQIPNTPVDSQAGQK